MIAPAAVGHRCIWQEDQAGNVFCVTRRTLRTAVTNTQIVASQARGERARAVAAKRRDQALRELVDHSCEPMPVDGPGFRKTMGRQGVNDPALGREDDPTPPTRGEHGGGVHVAPRSAGPISATNPRTPTTAERTSGAVERSEAEMQARPVGGGAVHAVAAPAPAGPVTALDVGNAYAAATEAAKKLGEAREFAGTDVHADALTAFIQADQAFWRALYDYRPPRRPIDFYLNSEEPRG